MVRTEGVQTQDDLMLRLSDALKTHADGPAKAFLIQSHKKLLWYDK